LVVYITIPAIVWKYSCNATETNSPNIHYSDVWSRKNTNVQPLAMIQTTPHLAYYNSSNSNFTLLLKKN